MRFLKFIISCITSINSQIKFYNCEINKIINKFYKIINNPKKRTCKNRKKIKFVCINS